MRPSKEKTPTGGKPVQHQQRREQPKVGGAGNDEPYDSMTGRKGAAQQIQGTEQPGEPKEGD